MQEQEAIGEYAEFELDRLIHEKDFREWDEEENNKSDDE